MEIQRYNKLKIEGARFLEPFAPVLGVWKFYRTFPRFPNLSKWIASKKDKAHRIAEAMGPFRQLFYH